MSKNLKELVLHQIYDVITNKKYEELSTFGEMIGLEKLRVLIELLQTLDGTEIVEQSEENLHTSAGTQLICNCTLGLPNILA